MQQAGLTNRMLTMIFLVLKNMLFGRWEQSVFVRRQRVWPPNYN